MPDYDITAPDGRKFRVTAPEGASEAEILSYAQQNMPAGEPARPIGVGGRIATGLGDPLYGAAQFMSHALSGVEQSAPIQWLGRQLGMGPTQSAADMDRRVQQRESEYQARRAAAGSEGFDWARMGGNVAAAVPAALALPAGTGLAGAAAAGAGSNALLSLAEPVTDGGDYWAAKKEQAELGAVTGAVGGAAGRLIGRAISPAVTPQVRALDDAGVALTPGQITGGAVRRMESGSTSLPIVGDAVRGAERRGIESFNRATANRVLEPLGQTVAEDAPVGRELIGAVEDGIRAAYDDAFRLARPFGPDQQFGQDVAREAQRFMTPQARQTFLSTLQDRVISRFQGGPLDGQTFKTIDSELGVTARQYSGSASAAEREMSQAFRGVQTVLRDLMRRQNPDAAPLMRAADAAQARFVRMQGAAAALGAQEGVFTPAQLLNAVKTGDRTVRDRAFTRGDALLQDLAEAGKTVMPSTVPDSGTPYRAALGVGAANMAGLLDPLTAGAGLGMLGAYTTTGQQILQRAMLAQRPAAVRALGNTIANAPLAGAVAGGLLSP